MCAFEYSASMNMDVLVDLVNASGNWIAGSRTGVAAGNVKTGSVTVSYSGLPADAYTWVAHLVPSGGDYTQAISTSQWAVSVAAPSGSVAISAAPNAIGTTGSSTISFNYSASTSMDVIMDLVSTANKWVAGTRVAVSAGNGKTGAATVPFSGIPAGTYNWTAHLVPSGGSWPQSISNSYWAVTAAAPTRGRK